MLDDIPDPDQQPEAGLQEQIDAQLAGAGQGGGSDFSWLPKAVVGAVVGILVWYALIGSKTDNDSNPFNGEQCIVTTLGVEVCGQSAVAWCEANSGLRSQVAADPYADAATRELMTDTDALCADLS